MLKTLLALLLLAGLANAQQTQITPDCDIPFTLTAAGQVTPNNTCGRNAIGVYDWQIVYYNFGFSALSLEVQSAPDNNGNPGTWVAFAGTIVNGVNPNTATTQGSTRLQGYFPFNRVNLTAATGTGSVKGHMYGCRAPGCSAAGANVTPTPVAPGAPDRSYQFNNAGVFAGSANFTYTVGNRVHSLVPVEVFGSFFFSNGVAFASLPAVVSGQSIYCTNCTVTSSIDNTAQAGGSGCYVNDVNGVHKCAGF